MRKTTPVVPSAKIISPIINIHSKTHMTAFNSDRQCAVILDQQDKLSKYRDQFHLLPGQQREHKIYLCGNSLGLKPKQADAAVMNELDKWQNKAVDAYFDGKDAWLNYQHMVSHDLADLVGAKPLEVVMMNSLSVNLHLMLSSFYRPNKQRFKIILEKQAFPSDRYCTV